MSSLEKTTQLELDTATFHSAPNSENQEQSLHQEEFPFHELPIRQHVETMQKLLQLDRKRNSESQRRSIPQNGDDTRYNDEDLSAGPISKTDELPRETDTGVLPDRRQVFRGSRGIGQTESARDHGIRIPKRDAVKELTSMPSLLETLRQPRPRSIVGQTVPETATTTTRLRD